MNLHKNLTTEMVKYMLAIFGLSENVIKDTIGINKEIFKTNRFIQIQYENEPINKYPIFSASTQFNESKLHVVGSFAIDEDSFSYSALFKLDNLYTYAIKYEKSDYDSVKFLVSRNKGLWSKLSMYEQIIACAGLEKLNDAGMVWKKEDLGDFYNMLVELVEM